MRFGILGPLDVADDQGPISIPAAKQRAVLAILLLRADTTVPGRKLIDELWDEPPVTARKVIQTYISKLRRVLPAGLLVTSATGYRLRLDVDDLDATRFERLVSDARRAAPSKEAALLREALALWRGRALEDFAGQHFAQADFVRLENLRLTVLERRIEIELAEGRHDLVLGELGGLVQENPLHERLRGQLMVALYRADRQTEALRVYRDGRRLLVEQLGVEPTPALRRLEQAILRQDPTLDHLGSTTGGPTPWPLPRASRSVGGGVTVHHRGGPEEPAQPGDAPLHRWWGGTAFGQLFVGRSEELEQLNALHLAGSRLLTLTGAAGTGKTRLAVEFARQVGPTYRDGWAMVDLSRVNTAGQVVPAICSTLGLHPTDPRDAMTVLAGFLGSRIQLVILDNFEHVLPAATAVSSLLERAPRLTVVVTSRSALSIDGEHRFEVGPLAVPTSGTPADLLAESDAVTLFVDRARTVRPDFVLTERTAAQVAQLCTHLDGLPLAIELAAARIDLLSPRAILSRLGDRLDLLAADTALLPERHRSLRAAVKWSYDLLDVQQQTAFCELSVFAGGFTADTAETVVTDLRTQLVDVVGALRHASLLRSTGAPGGEPRFAMLDTLREYGLGRLTLNGRIGEMRNAHAGAFRRLAEEAEPELRGPDQVRWLELLDAELPNIRQALDWCSSGGNPDTGLFVAAHLWRYWQVRGLTHEAREYLEAALATTSGSSAARAAGHLSAARCVFQLGDLNAVPGHIQASLPYHRQHEDMYSTGFGLLLLGAAAGRSGNAGQGSALLNDALDLAATSQDSWLHASCLGYLGMVSSARGEYIAARFALEEGLREVRELGDARLVGWFLIGLGRTALAAGDAIRAGRRFDEALAWNRRVLDDWGQAWSLQGLSGVALVNGHHQASVETAVQSLVPARRAHSRPALAGALLLLATVAHRQGRSTIAATLLGAASVLSGDHGEVWASDIDGVATVDAEAVRATIGDVAFADQWAHGRAMSTDQAVTTFVKTFEQTMPPRHNANG